MGLIHPMYGPQKKCAVIVIEQETCDSRDLNNAKPFTTPGIESIFLIPIQSQYQKPPVAIILNSKKFEAVIFKIIYK